MIKKELVKLVAQDTDLTQKKVQEVLETAFVHIKETVKSGDKVSLVGFGVFQQKDRAEKRGTNPSNGEPMVIPAKKVPVFRPGQEFKDLLK